MSLHTRESEDGRTVTIAVHGRFDFNIYRSFRDAYHKRGSSRYIIDLSNTEYIDSAALGMLLVLRDHCGGDQARIAILNSNPSIREILLVSNFNRLFEVG